MDLNHVRDPNFGHNNPNTLISLTYNKPLKCNKEGLKEENKLNHRTWTNGWKMKP